MTSSTSNSFDKLIQTPAVKHVKGVEKFTATEVYEPVVEDNADGTKTVTLSRDKRSPEAQLLKEAGFDPDMYMIDERRGVTRKEWDALRRVWVKDETLEQGGRYETKVQRLYGTTFAIKERPAPVNMQELLDLVDSKPAAPEATEGSSGALLLALGDLQLGKLESPTEGVLGRFNEALAAAVSLAQEKRVERVVILWLGDCIEGFVSQGGRNAWRTTLTLTEQLRIIRRMMLRSIDAFVGAGFSKVTIASVPGNHGDTMRSPVGTRSDDSYDTDALVAVADAMELNPERYGQVEVLVPGVDEIGVTLDVEGVKVGSIHGHQFRPGKWWDWWEGQSLGRTPYGACDVLFTGHGHHTVIEERSERTFVMAPALEKQSTWWLQKTGQGGNPGAIVAHFKNGRMYDLHKISTTHGMED